MMAAPRQATPSSLSRKPKEMSDVVGPFKILDEIGRGSFAEVYKAIHLDTKTAVAVKSVHLKKLNKKLKENLYSEIQILKGLHHPHIVALIDCHETPMHINLVMEYCSLGDLSRFIRKRDVLGGHSTTADMVRKYPIPSNAGLNEVIVRHFLKQMSSALEFLRARNFIHRDVKPQNMLLNPSPQYMRGADRDLIPMTASDKSLVPMVGIDSLPMLKLADFGFARSLPSTSLAETLCGSPLYMAPEILRYEKYDAKADLWSVGTVLYEMILGKPPFRASNHVELLKKIEKQVDEIRFPADVAISRPVKTLIRGLLKRKPVQRMSFEDFFANEVIQGPIPGLVEDDLAQQEAALALERGESPPEAPPTIAEETVRVRPAPRQTTSSRPAAPIQRPSSRRQSVEGTVPAERPPQSQRRFSSNFANSPARHSNSPESQQPSSRPRMTSHPTAPPATRIAAQQTPLNAAVSRRRSIDNSAKEARRKADQDVAFERDYVVVEKKSVEVNAFADELAASPRLRGAYPQSAPAHQHAMVRHTTAPGALPMAQGDHQTPQGISKAMAVAAKPKAGDHHRKPSYERRYGASPGSATSAISKALNLTSFRLFGLGFSPPLIGKGGQSPPPYGAFPAYPTNQGSIVLIGDTHQSGLATDDQRAVQLVEDIATRSDVVYAFAGVKYSQLIPWTPSTDRGLGPKDAEDVDPQSEISLTADVTVLLSEEALVLYVKALSLLAKVMDIASAWWTRRRRGEIVEHASPRSEAAPQTNSAAENRINSVVQWARARFNETLEKAEIVRLKLIEAQKQLSTSHPSHPDNHGSSSTGSTDGVTITSGVTAEKLMFLRAVELNRGAAVNELMNVDLKGCEIAYMTAHRMLEALLEREDLPHSKRSGEAKVDDEAINGIEATDRKEIEKMVSGTRGRLNALRKKMTMLEQQRAISDSRRPKSSSSTPPSTAR